MKSHVMMSYVPPPLVCLFVCLYSFIHPLHISCVDVVTTGCFCQAQAASPVIEDRKKTDAGRIRETCRESPC